MATSKIPIVKNSVNGTVTLLQSGAQNSLAIRQYGNVITITGYATGITLTANTETKIGDISGVPFPKEAARTVCSVGGAGYEMGTASYCVINTSGELRIRTSNGGSGKAVFFNITYIVE